MVIDFERAWLELKAYVVQKNSHGQRDLLREMAHVEVRCRLPESERNFDPTPITEHPPAVKPLREVARHG